MTDERPILTNRQGHPVHDNQNQRTIGARGPATLENYQVQYQREVAAARAVLDDATFAAAWAEGRAMTLEQAVAYALAGSGSDSVASTTTAAPSH